MKKIIIALILVIIVAITVLNLKRHFLILAKGIILFYQPLGELDADKSIDIWKEGTAVKTFVCRDEEDVFKLYKALFKKDVSLAKEIKIKEEEENVIWIVNNREMVEAVIDMRMIPYPLIKMVDLKEKGNVFLFSLVNTATFESITINGMPYAQATGGAIIRPGILFIQNRLFGTKKG